MSECAKAAREWIADARSIVVLTGAGISAESGIPTFRGPGGVWRQQKAQELATPEGFARDPAMVWAWYLWRRGLIAKAEPNQGHKALAELERKTERFTLLTQNVDELHQRAGSKRVFELHGSIWVSRCVKCGKSRHDERTSIEPLPPLCSCGGMLRPGVVWFGEALDPAVMRAAEHTIGSADVMLVVGTSAVVYPAAGLVPLAKSSGAKVIEVNMEETPMSGLVDCSLRGPSGQLLPELIR